VSARRVVVTGLGVVAPNAVGAAAFAQALREGKSGIAFQPRLAELGFGCRVGGIPKGIPELAERYFDPEQRFSMDANITYASIAAIDAWTDGGLARPAPDSADVDWASGAIIGTGLSGMDPIAEELVPGTNAGRVTRLGSNMVEQIMASGNSARIGGLLALGNQVSTNSAACATGTEALANAFWRVRNGLAERMLAGGSESHSPYVWAGFDAMRVMNRAHNDAPERASRPMSASAGGFVPGAGAGVLLLESLESALARGARIYAEIAGVAVNCGGHRQGGSMTAPNPNAARRCIRDAVRLAGIVPRDIDAINGHLTATRADPLEVGNWAAALELGPREMPLLHATKSLIGHTLAAAGGIESAACVLELHHGFLHGSRNCEDVHPAILPYEHAIVRETRELSRLRVIAKASFGFGDVNACVVFRSFSGEAQEPHELNRQGVS
jgi:3-oxoacyl-(acyl-carrier-protein) synthase